MLRASTIQISAGRTVPHASASKKAGMVEPVVDCPNQYVASKFMLHTVWNTAPALPGRGLLFAAMPYTDKAELVGSTPSTATSMSEGISDALLMSLTVVSSVCQPGHMTAEHVDVAVLGLGHA